MKTFSNADYTEGSYEAARKGIKPHEYAIPTGTVLYRFIDLSKAPSSKGADGPWWFEYEHYKVIESFAERHDYSLGYAARLFAAILYEWSEVNAIVRAEVINGPLFAWKGEGKQVSADRYDGKGRVIPSKRTPDPRDVASPHGALTERRGPDGQPPLMRKMTPMQGPLSVLQIFIPGLGAPHHKFASFMKLKGSPQHIESLVNR